MRKPSPATIIAIAALVVALGGTAIAASHYIITSTSQIKPSVLRELRGGGGSALAAATAKAARAVIARVRSPGPVETVTEPSKTGEPLVGPTWKESTQEDQLLLGDVTVTHPPASNCTVNIGAGKIATGSAHLHALLDGQTVSDVYAPAEGPNPATIRIGFFSQIPDGAWLVAPSAPMNHSLIADVSDDCGVGPGASGGGHFTINSVSVDVVGVR
jgi:hypothetical protein